MKHCISLCYDCPILERNDVFSDGICRYVDMYVIHLSSIFFI